MSLYTLFLSAHILGALTTLLLSGLAVFALTKKQSQHYQFSAYALAFAAVFQTLTGAMLAVLSPEITALSLCDNLAFYITPIAVLELMLISRMRSFESTVSVPRIAVPMLGSVAAFCVLVVVGV